ncbi:MAG TPA: glycosyltransferase family 2 protein [Polyangia bacterium]|nr:glycosyltransferase family 2 protein [Polyangia bacterium]
MSSAPKKLSIIVPAYNERATISELLRRVRAVPLPGLQKEIIIVDDCSNDGTRDLLEAEKIDSQRVLLHEVNRGKGAAIRTGLQHATGDVIMIQDADLEYDPSDYPTLLKPIMDGDADVVYGSRFKGGAGSQRVLYFWHSIGNIMLTTMSNVLSGLNMSDMETCYKVFRAEVIKSVNLRSERFGFEPEITMKIARGKHWRVYEVPISYRGRTYEQGKKIGLKDAFSAVYVMLRARFLDPI